MALWKTATRLGLLGWTGYPMVKEGVSGEDLKREVVLPGEEMAILSQQHLSANPLDVGSNEGIGRLQSSPFVLVSNLKGHHGILVNLSQEAHDPKEPMRSVWRQMAEDFLNDRAGDPDIVERCGINQVGEQGATRSPGWNP